jgi:hypothetical protein
VLLALSSLTPRPSESGLHLDVSPVPLNPEDVAQRSVGPLRYRGGLWLRSSDPRFGGLSDLVVCADGRRLLAVSDCGRGFEASLAYDAGGALVGLDGARLVDLKGPGGRALEPGDVDAEALGEDAEGALLVGFEGRPRVWRYAGPPFAGSPEPLALPELTGCTGNRGLEALVHLDGGRLLLLCEGASLRPSSCPAWISGKEGWTPRSYPADDGGAGPRDVYRPTSATLLPGGDVLVLERRYPPLGARLRRLAKADLEGIGALAPREVAVLEPPLTLDNLEGIEARLTPTGETLVYLLSDDNGCAKGSTVGSRLQRTLLLVFALDVIALDTR